MFWLPILFVHFSFLNILPLAHSATVKSKFNSHLLSSRQHLNPQNLTKTLKLKSRSNNYQNKFNSRGPLGIRYNAMKIHNVYVGFIPDAGDTGGSVESMSEITNSLNGKKSAIYGWYAQVSPGWRFDGKQLTEIIKDLKNCDCVFNPTIMPQGGWSGFNSYDKSQAIAIAKVLRTFTDQGIPVWLRFAHEANWYQRTGQYSGGPWEFKEAWQTVADAVHYYAPDVLLHWSPNVASSMEEYKKYEPWDMDRNVDIVGIDYYPKVKPHDGDFVKVIKEFHDKYAVNGRKLAIGETGLHYPGSLQDKLSWLDQLGKSKQQLPNLLSITWYNSKKEWDYKIAGKGISSNLLAQSLE